MEISFDAILNKAEKNTTGELRQASPKPAAELSSGKVAGGELHER